MSAPQPLAGLPRHGILDDIQGLGTGAFMCAYGTSVLAGLGLITGQSAGLALLLSHLFGLGFGFWFFLGAACYQYADR